MKKRIDRLIVDRGLVPSREKAQALLMAGLVRVGEQRVLKAGLMVPEDAAISVQPSAQWVSRAGGKLDGALRYFAIDVKGMVAADIGSSTGGFTQVLLESGASLVFAVDVDTRQLDWKIRQDPRVRLVEMNARFLETGHFGQLVDLITIDVSFISATRVLERVPALLTRGGRCLTLVKPQFELDRQSVGAGGIVREPALHRKAIDRVTEAGRELGLTPAGECESEVPGREGNIEFFVLFVKP